MMEKTYVSSLAPFIEAFVEFKHSLGWKYATGEFYLHGFDRYCAEYESEATSLKDIIKSWVILRDTECPNTQHVRVAPIREFGKYLQSSGYSDSYVIPKKVCQKQSRTIPHFFTNDEIVKFFNVCDMLPQRKENIVRHLVLPMLYRLLYCCGVRTCEARLLMRENANLQIGYIDILYSKGLKDRRVFLPEDLRSLYMKYDVIINDIFPNRTYFFPAKLNTGYQCGTIGQNFNKIWKAAGLGEESGSKARAYDFRHHFALSNLNRWIEEETDVNSMLPYLMRYMGHSCLESTFYYLHLVPEFFVTFSEKTKMLERLLPEVGYGEEE
ncbi:MAG: tyrosine-type recombinase/integrase [Desulfosporosinus sp.]|nr:tyrosine-type recombinase/integrase [Desulfosporosinus sp.]